MHKSEISKEELESVASRPVEKYPDGYLSKPQLIMWEGWAVAIRGPDLEGLDTLKAIIKGSYMEIRAFELAYHRLSEKLFFDGW
jgi:hypothetical protein